ncbi:MAG TPA: serine hydrolase, partial [Hyphomicrobiales bacterium]|nr:serine hydrolase [Hyphomicrobiales bacterium]
MPRSTVARLVQGLVSFLLMLGVATILVLPQQADARPKGWSASKYAAIVIDANTDRVLFSRRADSHRYPASLTKRMTLYMLFSEMRAGRITESTKIRFSAHAAGQAPSKLGLKPGQTISARAAALSLVTKSANDVAAAIAEHIGGSESKFARMMTERARALGMKSTTFRNASGLPDSGQRTTARDMARLAAALMHDFPEYYHYFKTRSFAYGGRNYRNHNRLLGRVSGVDGIKTGYTRASGFNLTASARRGSRHLIAVVMGGPSGRSRDNHMTYLLDTLFAKASTERTVIALPDVAPLPPMRPAMKAARQVVSAEPEPVAPSATVKPRVLSASAPLMAAPADDPIASMLAASQPAEGDGGPDDTMPQTDATTDATTVIAKTPAPPLRPELASGAAVPSSVAEPLPR